MNAISVPSRKRATIFNLARDYTSMGLLIIRGIVLVPIYLHFIDSRLYGAWLASGNIVAFLGLLDFGFTSVIVQRIANTAGQRDDKRLGGLIGTSLATVAILSLLPLLCAGLIYRQVPVWIHIEAAQAEQISYAFLIAALSTSLMVIAYGTGGILAGLQWVGVVSIQFIVSSIIGIAATLIFLYMGVGLLAIPLGFLTQSGLLAVAHGLYLWRVIRKQFPPGIIGFDKSNFLDLFRHSSWVFLSKLSLTTSRQADNLIVAAMIDPGLTTILVLTKKSSDILTMAAIRISSAFMPSLSHLSGEGDKQKSKRFMFSILKISIMLAVFAMGGIFLLNHEFVRLWVGDKFYGGTVLTGLICIAGFLFVFNQALYNTIFSQGKIRTAARAQIFQAVIQIILSITLCYYFGMKGVVLAAIIAMLSTSSWIQGRCFVHILGMKWPQAFKFLFELLLKASVPVLFGLTLKVIWKPYGLAEFIIFSILYTAFAMLFYVLIDKDLQQLIKIVLKKIKGQPATFS